MEISLYSKGIEVVLAQQIFLLKSSCVTSSSRRTEAVGRVNKNIHWITLYLQVNVTAL